MKNGKTKLRKLQKLAKRQGLNTARSSDWMINALVVRWEEACGLGGGGLARNGEGEVRAFKDLPGNGLQTRNVYNYECVT